jgi:antitoxin component HigA of HigAB toxin-antitoxin module
MSGKRELSTTMIQRLRERFHIPADVLIPPMNVTSRKKAAA